MDTILIEVLLIAAFLFGSSLQLCPTTEEMGDACASLNDNTYCNGKSLSISRQARYAEFTPGNEFYEKMKSLVVASDCKVRLRHSAVLSATDDLPNGIYNSLAYVFKDRGEGTWENSIATLLCICQGDDLFRK